MHSAREHGDAASHRSLRWMASTEMDRFWPHWSNAHAARICVPITPARPSTPDQPIEDHECVVDGLYVKVHGLLQAQLYCCAHLSICESERWLSTSFQAAAGHKHMWPAQKPLCRHHASLLCYLKSLQPSRAIKLRECRAARVHRDARHATGSPAEGAPRQDIRGRACLEQNETSCMVSFARYLAKRPASESGLVATTRVSAQAHAEPAAL